MKRGPVAHRQFVTFRPQAKQLRHKTSAEAGKEEIPYAIYGKILSRFHINCQKLCFLLPFTC